ncbi:MAG TPA: hypothetical protein ENI26_12705 [Methylophaga aminisulfidivorans]|uniref:Porin n=1 Tax=Methylophaga aminisulfidivorans TaxID=230105 RepID=A0A7C2A8T3_9GAMM|nr:hypothetical protein [Methylophaga aminisulfidivorans]
MLVINRLQFVIYLFATLWSLTANAFETGSDKLRINGYGTLGLAHTDSKDAYYRLGLDQEGYRDGYDLKMLSNLGLQINYFFSDTLEFNTQLLLKDVPDYSANRAFKTAFLKYQPNSQFDISLGRMTNDAYLLSDYKDVGFARLWAHVPVEFYGPVSTDGYDGIRLQYHQPFNDGVFSTSVWGGTTKYPLYSRNGSASVKLQPNMGLILRWEDQTWLFRLFYSQGKINSPNDRLKALDKALIQAEQFGWNGASSIGPFTYDDTWLRYLSAGVSYERDGWVISTELSYAKSDSTYNDDALSGYLSIGHRFDSVTPFIMLSQTKSLSNREKVDAAPAGFDSLQQIAQVVADLTYRDQHSLSLGARWDIMQKVSLKAQWDRTWIGAYGGVLFESQPNPSQDHSIDTVSITMDFIF